MYEIEFYADERGYSDVESFVYKLREESKSNKDARINFNKVVAYLDALEEMGTRVGALCASIQIHSCCIYMHISWACARISNCAFDVNI